MKRRVTGGGSGRILLTGATGYVGGRLRELLEQTGRPLRCMARTPGHLAGRVACATEVVAGDALRRETLAGAVCGVHTAYYLIHSMAAGPGFEAREARAAEHFAQAAAAAQVKRIIYAGGLGEPGRGLSPHLESRQRVGRLLHSTGVPVIEFRASIVIGSGSLSFEMIRALVERLPVMILPRWVSVACQPIAIRDLLAYLVEALDHPLPAGHQIYEIGGSERASYGDVMRAYATRRGLRRVMIPVPVLSPRLSSLWLGLVTPLLARVGRILIESIRNPTVVRDAAALGRFRVRPRGVAAAIASALEDEEHAFVRMRWSDWLAAGRAPRGGLRQGNRLIDTRARIVETSLAEAFAPIRRIGGRTGWYYGGWLWRLRGALDLLIGGVGMRRGRRHPDLLRPGDVVDCWRVEACEPDRRLRLVAEMRLPGRAWLEFEVTRAGDAARIRQTAIFDPLGLCGLVYWYLLYPVHALLFAGLLRRIAERARKERRADRA